MLEQVGGKIVLIKVSEQNQQKQQRSSRKTVTLARVATFSTGASRRGRSARAAVRSLASKRLLIDMITGRSGDLEEVQGA